MTSYSLDRSTRRPSGSDVVVGGSPLRLFRLTPAGAEVFDRISAGEQIAPSPAVDGLIDRLLDAGAIHPHPRSSPYTSADVAVVVPAHVLGDPTGATRAEGETILRRLTDDLIAAFDRWNAGR